MNNLHEKKTAAILANVSAVGLAGAVVAAVSVAVLGLASPENILACVLGGAGSYSYYAAANCLYHNNDSRSAKGFLLSANSFMRMAGICAVADYGIQQAIAPRFVAMAAMGAGLLASNEIFRRGQKKLVRLWVGTSGMQ